MQNDFYDGEFITAKKLETWIKEIFSSMRSKVSNLIPKGSLTTYSFLANKNFSYRPYSNAQSYSSIPKDEPLLGEKLAYSLATPWTLDLATSLNLQGKINFTGLTSTYNKGDIFPYNPLTDLVNNIPLKGNSPVIYNGYLGLSNFCQDTNIRVYPSEDGMTLTVKAQRVSVLHRYTSSTNYQITTDFMNSSPDREDLEWRHLDSLDLTVSNTNVFSTVSSGFSPSIANSNDYGVWLIYNPRTSTPLLALTKWDNNYPAISNIVNNIYTTSTPYYYNTALGTTFPYIRCLACVYLNSDGKFEFSKEKIWGEFESNSLNGNPLFTKLYQQDNSLNTVIRNQTNSLDRRVIPSYYYQEQKNASIHNLVNYNGIIRDVPSTGQAQCYIYSDGINISIESNCLELSNGTSSYFANNISKTFNAFNFLCDTGTGSSYVGSSGAHETNSSYYIWAAVNPYSVLEQNIEGFDGSTTQSTFMSKSNMQFKVFASQSHSWSGISSAFKTSQLKGYDWRCRIGWFKRTLRNNSAYAATSGNGITPFTNIDGNIFIANRPQQKIFTESGTSIGVNNDYQTFTTVSTVTTPTQVPYLYHFLPTVNCNTTNSTVDWVSGTMKSYNTSSTSLFPTVQFIVDCDYSILGFPVLYTPWLNTSTSSTTTYKGRHVLSSPFHIPVFGTTSTINYYYTCNVPGSTGIISFENFFLPNGAF